MWVFRPEGHNELALVGALIRLLRLLKIEDVSTFRGWTWSEVGKLHQVMVCRPGLAHERLTPANCKELLFDDVL